MAGGLTWDAATNAFVVPAAGWYRVNAQYFFTGSAGASATGFVIKNGVTTVPVAGRINMWKADAADYMGHSTGLVQLAANDKIQLWINYVSSTWGTNGWDGSYMEIEYVCPIGQV
jgi:hypothetical protein